ncbi:3-oxoacyl-ACP reductase [Cupriavidus necator]
MNAIAPGFIETDCIKSLPNYETVLQNAVARIQVPGVGQPGDIAAAVAFMASEHARYITGTTLFVTGGRYG